MNIVQQSKHHTPAVCTWHGKWQVVLVVLALIDDSTSLFIPLMLFVRPHTELELLHNQFNYKCASMESFESFETLVTE